MVQLEDLLKKLHKPATKTVLCGDFNTDFRINSEDKNLVLDTLSPYGLEQYVFEPTRVCVFAVFQFLWKKRWLLYHSWKIPGPFAVPLVGTIFLLSATKSNFFELTCQVLNFYRPVTKFWVGSQLYIISTRPTDVEKILTNCLNKSPFYNTIHDEAKNTLLTSPVSVWKEHRKMINPSFNPKVLNSFHDIFVDYSRKMVEFLESTHGKETTDLTPIIWQNTLDSTIETLTNIKPHLIKERYNAISATMKIEEILIQRLRKFWLLTDFFWKLSSLRKEYQQAWQKGHKIIENILAEQSRSIEFESVNPIRSQRFLPHLNKLNRNKQITHEDILEEASLMSIAGSETTAITINIILTFLGIYSDVQEKAYQEVVSVTSCHEDPTLEEINRLEYVERVIKETLRLIPLVPFLMRSNEADITSDPFVFPAGCNFLIPVVTLHRDPEVWPDPEKFDPDRFLPDEVAKRHRCSFIPFSFGSRNCIGLKYGMMSMKVMIAMIVKTFKIRSVGMKSWKDMECDFLIMLKPKNSHLMFEKRTN
ncbi:cytochrome P450 4C1-like isoform X2 [Zophobas morio]